MPAIGSKANNYQKNTYTLFAYTLTLNFDSSSCNTSSSHALFIEFKLEHVQT